MEIEINTSLSEPVYEQIARQIHEAVTSGILKPGTRLPSVRQLSTDLVLNRVTVARAFWMLEGQGTIMTVARRGTFVRHNATPVVTETNPVRISEMMRQVLETRTLAGPYRKTMTDALSASLLAARKLHCS